MKVKVDLNKVRKRSVDLLYNVVTIFEEQGIKYWLDQGTLLGAIRENDFITWDDDIDLGVWKHDINSCPLIWDYFKKSGYYVFHRKKLQAVRIEAKNPEIGWRSIDINIYHRAGINAIKYFEKRLDNKFSSIFNKLFLILDHIQFIKYGPDLRYKNISDYIITNSGFNNSGIVYIDVKDSNGSLFYPILAIIYKNFVPNQLIRFLKHIISQAKLQTCIEIITLKTPISFFENPSKYNFLGITTAVPNPVNDYLCFKYGSDWLTPKNKNDWVYNRDDGAITTSIK